MEQLEPVSDVRQLAELLAQHLNATANKVRLTLIFVDGRLVDCYRDARFSPRELEDVPVTSATLARLQPPHE
jgi:hypothetical protein